MVCEADDESSLKEADEFWTAYIEDLPAIAELKPAERALAQAMVWQRIGEHCVEGVEAAEEDYQDDKDGFGDDWEEEDRQSQLNWIAWLKNRAGECFNRAIELAPAHAAPHHHLAKAHAQWGEEESAAAAYERLLAHVPDDFEAIVALYKHHRRRGEGPAAREYALQAHRLKPASSEVSNMVVKARLDAARVLAGAGRFDEARAELSALEAEGGAAPQYDLTVARAMIEFKAAVEKAPWRLVDQALAESDDPADVYLVLAIEAVRYDLPFQLNDLAEQFREKWEASLKKRRSRAAGPMSRRMLAIIADAGEFEGRQAFLSGFLERFVKYVKGCTRIRWQADDLVEVCQLIYRLVEDSKNGAARKALLKLLDSGRKKLPQEPLFHWMRGELEIGRGPYYCDRRLARQCFETTIEAAKTLPRPDAKKLAAGAAERVGLLESHGDAPPRPRRPSRVRPETDFAGIPPEIFDEVPPEQLVEAITRMSMALGLDPEKMVAEIAANLGAGAASKNEKKATSAAAQGST